MYFQQVPAGRDEPGPPQWNTPEMQAFFEAGKRAIENHLWREDLERWDREVKPDSIERNGGLQAIDPSALDDDGLRRHLVACRDNLDEMIYRHHIFSAPSILPVGLFLAEAGQWTGLPPGELLATLKGTSPISTGIGAAELAELGDALRRAGRRPEDLDESSGRDAAEVLSELAGTAGDVGSATKRYLDEVGLKIITGYDVSEHYALETPELLRRNIRSALSGDAAGAVDVEATRAVTARVREAVPEPHRQRFDELLGEARNINRLRDERGVYNDLWAFGLSRRAILEAGRRLAARGQLPDAGLLIHAEHDAMLQALSGDITLDVDALRALEQHRENATTADAPAVLGDPPQPPPPLEALPEAARLGAMGLGAAMGNVFDAPESEADDESSIHGLPVSPGTYTGPARVVLGSADFARIQQGDVLVTRNTSASFNVVLPLLGALVADRGGQLSHAAIVAREYGIPGVVSTRKATVVIPDGARITVDGTNGTVEVEH